MFKIELLHVMRAITFSEIFLIASLVITRFPFISGYVNAPYMNGTAYGTYLMLYLEKSKGGFNKLKYPMGSFS